MIPTYVYGTSVTTTAPDNRVTVKVINSADDGFGNSNKISGIELIVEVSGNDASDNPIIQYQRLPSTSTSETYFDSIYDGISYQYRYAHVYPDYYDLSGIVDSNWNDATTFINNNGIADRVSDLSWTDYSGPVFTRRAPDAPASVVTSVNKNATYDDNQVGQVSLTITEDISYDRWGDVSMDKIVVRIEGINESKSTFSDQTFDILSSNQSHDKRTATVSHYIDVSGLGIDFSGNFRVAFTNSYKTHSDLDDLSYEPITGLHTRRRCKPPTLTNYDIYTDSSYVTPTSGMVQVTLPDFTPNNYGGDATISGDFVDISNHLAYYKLQSEYKADGANNDLSVTIPNIQAKKMEIDISAALTSQTTYTVNSELYYNTPSGTSPTSITGLSSEDISFTTDSLSSDISDGFVSDRFWNSTYYGLSAEQVGDLSAVTLAWKHSEPFKPNSSTGDSVVFGYLILAQSGTNESIVGFKRIDGISNNADLSFTFGVNNEDFSFNANDSTLGGYHSVTGSTSFKQFLETYDESYNDISYSPSQTSSASMTVTQQDSTDTEIIHPEIGYDISYSLRVIWKDQDRKLHSVNEYDYAITPAVGVRTTRRPEIVSVEKQITSDDSSYNMVITYRTGGLDLQNFHIITTGNNPKHLAVTVATENNKDNHYTQDISYTTATLSYSEHETNDSVIIFISNAKGSNTYHLDLSGSEIWSADLLPIDSVTESSLVPTNDTLVMA